MKEKKRENYEASMNFLSVNICDGNSSVMTQTNKRWIACFAYINKSVSTKNLHKNKTNFRVEKRE